MKELICIMCPKGCRLTVDDELNVTGNGCIRGVSYGKQEVTNPRRYLTSTVKIVSSRYKRLPVISDGDLPKEKVSEVMKYLDNVEVPYWYIETFRNPTKTRQKAYYTTLYFD